MGVIAGVGGYNAQSIAAGLPPVGSLPVIAAIRLSALGTVALGLAALLLLGVALLTRVAAGRRATLSAERKRLLANAQEARAEAVARAAERDAVFDAMADGVFVFDGTGTVTRTNAAFRALMGITSERAGQYTSYSVLERGAELRMRDEDGQPLPSDTWPVSRILRGEVLTGGLLEITVRAFDGRDVLLGVSGAALRDPDGRIMGGVCVCRDMTERRRLERRTQEALEALLMMAEALVYIEDGDAAGTEAVARRLVALTSSVLDCQRVSITGYDAASGASYAIAAVGLTPEQEQAWRSNRPGAGLRDYLNADQLARLQAEDVVIVDSSEAAGGELPYGVRTMLIALMRVGQNLVGVMAMDHGAVAHTYSDDDVALTRAVAKLTGLVIERERLLRERAEAQANALALHEANRRMDAFLALASHELKTPLTTISGNIQVAERRLQRLTASDGRHAEQLAPLLERAHRNIIRLNRLVDDLLDMSRIQSDHLQMQRERCDLVAIVREVADEQHSLYPERPLLRQLPLDGTVEVVGDAGRLGQVALNYLTNAYKYAPPERPIELGLRVEGAQARVWVRDEGPGLSPEEQQRVWDRFYRVGDIEHQSGSHVGLGLGLYISRTIIAEHGGEVGVESVPGAGATFWFTLPLAQYMRHEDDA